MPRHDSGPTSGGHPPDPTADRRLRPGLRIATCTDRMPRGSSLLGDLAGSLPSRGLWGVVPCGNPCRCPKARCNPPLLTLAAAPIGTSVVAPTAAVGLPPAVGRLWWPAPRRRAPGGQPAATATPHFSFFRSFAAAAPRPRASGATGRSAEWLPVGTSSGLAAGRGRAGGPEDGCRQEAGNRRPAAAGQRPPRADKEASHQMKAVGRWAGSCADLGRSRGRLGDEGEMGGYGPRMRAERSRPCTSRRTNAGTCSPSPTCSCPPAAGTASLRPGTEANPRASSARGDRRSRPNSQPPPHPRRPSGTSHQLMTSQLLRLSGDRPRRTVATKNPDPKREHVRSDGSPARRPRPGAAVWTLPLGQRRRPRRPSR